MHITRFTSCRALSILGALCLLALFGGPVAAQVARSDRAYASSLRTKYIGRITFSSSRARRIIEGFAIDCQAPDGRTLPLMNVLLSKLAQLDGKNGHLIARVDNRGEEIRVYDEWVEGGRVIDSVLAFEINKWGDLRSFAARPEAIRNACFGSYGYIWEGGTPPSESGRARRLGD